MRKICKFVLGTFLLAAAAVAAVPQEAEAAAGKMDWKWPVPQSNTISSCYLDGREHYAIDIKSGYGANVYACYEGVVIQTYASCSHNYEKYGSCGCEGGLGNNVYIRHEYNGTSYVSRYGHLSDVFVEAGDKVTEDTIIGLVGCTGASSGSHLDLRIWEGTSERYDKTVDCVDPLLDQFLEIPEGINANSSSTGCCYSYIHAVKEMQEEYLNRRPKQEIAASNMTAQYGTGSFFLQQVLKGGNGKLTYDSSNPEVAVVLEGGRVVLNGIGTTEITITASETYEFCETVKTITLTVVPRVEKVEKNYFAMLSARGWVRLEIEEEVEMYKLEYSMIPEEECRIIEILK